MFQSMLAPVHCCPASRKWTPEPTLNRKNQDCLVILRTKLKSRLRDILQTVVFPAKVYLCALGQHCASNFLMQCCLRRIWTTLTKQFSYARLSQHGWYIIIWVIFLRKVVFSVCNFQSMKTPVELNSLLWKFFCYITWFVISPD